MYAGDGEVRTYAHSGNGDERVAQHRFHFGEEDFAEVLLNETGYFVLTGGLHGFIKLKGKRLKLKAGNGCFIDRLKKRGRRAASLFGF
jgi:hypothetical protein